MIPDFLLAEVARLVANPLIFLSLGAGVQSSTVPLMCAAGELPYTINAGIFADTRAEPNAVYEWLSWLEKQLPFPVYRVSRGNLAVDSIRRRMSKKGRHYWQVQVPFYMAMATPVTVLCPDCYGEEAGAGEAECRKCGGGGRIDTGETTIRKGKLNRKCTAEYKIREIVKKQRALVGARVISAWRRVYGVRRERVGDSWVWRVPEGTPPLARTLIGISLDEIQRVKPSREPWVENVHPLVEARITRRNCLAWMRARGFPQPPRSACVFCPYHSDAEWARMKRDDPESFRIAAEFEAAAAACDVTEGVPFLHSSLKPLPLVQFREEREDAQRAFSWAGECEGICGV